MAVSLSVPFVALVFDLVRSILGIVFTYVVSLLIFWVDCLPTMY